MTQKLTLSVDREKVRKAKYFSRKRKRSVSKLFEDFVDELERKDTRTKKRSVVEELRGAFGSVPKNWDWKKEKMKILEKKHGR
jgi:hypothetical protein